MVRPQELLQQDDGLAHYRALGLAGKAASLADIKQAYRRRARTLHPDKGGSAAAFAALQAAFETLSDPQRRATYDALAGDVRFRPRAAAASAASSVDGSGQADDGAPPPGVTEAVLLQQLLARAGSHPGAVFDPSHQLCVTCEVCCRPATTTCWTCGMDVCELCTRRQHWKGAVALHWPLVNRPGSLLEQLGKRELELKRQHDGQAFNQAQPGYRPQPELLLLRQFQDAIVDVLQAATACSSKAAARVTGPAVSLSSSVTDAAAAPGRATAAKASGSVDRTAFAMRPPGTPARVSEGTSSSSSSGGGAALVAAPTSSTAVTVSSASRALTPAVKPLALTANRCHAAWQAAGSAGQQAVLQVYNARLARFYAWSQTDCSILLAVHLPTGGGKVPPKLRLEPTATTLTVQHEGFAPVLHRTWASRIDAAAGVSSWLSGDGQQLLLQVAKAAPGRQWAACFQGDAWAARCLQAPYRLLQLPGEVTVELPLPFWVDPVEDLDVAIADASLTVTVEGGMALRRTYHRHAAQEAKQGPGSYKVVDVAASSWCLLDQGVQPAVQSAPTSSSSSPVPSRRKPDRLLSISLVLPEPTQEEVQFKNGVRQNNAAAMRSCPNGAGLPGYSFFQDDEDEFGLHSLLQALLFHTTGETWLLPKPWEQAAGSVVNASSGGSSHARYQGGRRVRDEPSLPADVARHLAWLRRGAGDSAGGESGSSALVMGEAGRTQ